jgi:hypothetical protein
MVDLDNNGIIGPDPEPGVDFGFLARVGFSKTGAYG